MRSRPAREASDYFVRQGTDPDGLAAELDTPEQAPALHRHLLHVAVLGPPGRLPRRGRPRAGRPVRWQRHRRLPHRAVRRRRQAAGQLRRLRERVRRRGAQRAADDGAQRRDRGAASCSARATTCSIPTSTAWPRSCSPTTSGRSCSATAATSSRGRRDTDQLVSACRPVALCRRPASRDHRGFSAWPSLILRGRDARRDRAEGPPVARPRSKARRSATSPSPRRSNRAPSSPRTRCASSPRPPPGRWRRARS